MPRPGGLLRNGDDDHQLSIGECQDLWKQVLEACREMKRQNESFYPAFQNLQEATSNWRALADEILALHSKIDRETEKWKHTFAEYVEVDQALEASANEVNRLQDRYWTRCQ